MDGKPGHGWEAVPTGVVVIIQSHGWEAVPTGVVVIIGSRSYKTRDYKTGHGWEAVPTGVVVIIQSHGWEAVPTRPAVIKRGTVGKPFLQSRLGSRSYKTSGYKTGRGWEAVPTSLFLKIVQSLVICYNTVSKVSDKLPTR